MDDQATARIADRNIRAEARGVEEGHLCRWVPARRLFIVKSDRVQTLDYELTVSAALPAASGALADDEPLLIVSCTPCPTSGRQGPAGLMGCKHRTRVARRLERLGFARFDGSRWRVTRPLLELAWAIAEDEDEGHRYDPDCGCDLCREDEQERAEAAGERLAEARADEARYGDTAWEPRA